MNKKFGMMLMTMVLVGATFVGCGNNEIVQEEIVTEQPAQGGSQGQGTEISEEIVGEKDPTPADEAYYVATNGIQNAMSMTADDVMLRDAYGIDPAILDSYRVEMGMNRAAVSEIAVFEVKDEKDIDKVKEGIAKRQKDLEKQWESYLEDQYNLVKNAQVVVDGKKVLYVISNDADQIVSQFKQIADQQ